LATRRRPAVTTRGVATDGIGALSVFLVKDDTALYRYSHWLPSYRYLWPSLWGSSAWFFKWTAAKSMGASWANPGLMPTVVRNDNGALSVFLVGDDAALYRCDQGAEGAWDSQVDFISMGGSWTRPAVTPTVAGNWNGALSVFLVGDDIALYRYDQQGPNGGWGMAVSMGGSWMRPAVTPTVIRKGDGTLSVFLIGNDTALYRYDQRHPNGTWGAPAKPIPMDGSAKPPPRRTASQESEPGHQQLPAASKPEPGTDDPHPAGRQHQPGHEPAAQDGGNPDAEP